MYSFLNKESQCHSQSVTFGGQELRDPKVITQHFNHYFINIPKKFACKFHEPAVSLYAFLKDRRLNDFTLFPIATKETSTVGK